MEPQGTSIPAHPGPIRACACGCGCELRTCNGVCFACRGGQHDNVYRDPFAAYSGTRPSDEGIRNSMIGAGRSEMIR